MKINQAVILAGGLGTRLKPLTDNIPKPMIGINNKPFLEYLIELLKENKIRDILLLLGYLPEKITDYFGDGRKFGVNIKYSVGNIDFEKGKRIKHAEKLLDRNFLLMYCDNYFPLDVNKLVEYHESHNAQTTMTIYSNKDGFTKNNVLVDEKGFVTKYDKSRLDNSLNGVDIGFFIMGKDVVDIMPQSNFDLAEIFPELIKRKKLAGFITNHKYYDIGKIERLPATTEYLKYKKVIFLDRDGVINKKAPQADYVKNWKEFEFLPGAKEAISLLTKKGYDIYIISNQAGISRKMMTEDDLKVIHENMIKEIEEQGGKIKKIYYCPHGWDSKCECRKPKPGMLFQAAREHHINLKKTIFIGDDRRDVETGNAADVKTILIDENNNLLNVVKFIINIDYR